LLVSFKGTPTHDLGKKRQGKESMNLKNISPHGTVPLELVLEVNKSSSSSMFMAGAANASLLLQTLLGNVFGKGKAKRQILDLDSSGMTYLRFSFALFFFFVSLLSFSFACALTLNYLCLPLLGICFDFTFHCALPLFFFNLITPLPFLCLICISFLRFAFFALPNVAFTLPFSHFIYLSFAFSLSFL
jgi:hypothetical protein